MDRDSINNQLIEDIVVSAYDMPGHSLGCLMVDRNLKLLWHKPFISSCPGSAKAVEHCYEIFNRKHPCENCAALQAFSTGSPSSCETAYIDDTGEKRFCHFIGSPIYDANRRVVRFIEVMQDVTERKESEEKYRQINDFNYNIIYNSPVAIFTLNREGLITSTNPAHIKIAGNPPLEEIIGFDWLHSSNAVKTGLDEYLKKGLAGESFEVTDFPYESNLTGRKIFMTLRGVPIRNREDEVEVLLCIIEDTTEKTAYFKKVEHLKNYNENVIRSIGNGIMVVDTRLRTLTWNSGMKTIFGFDSKVAFNLSLSDCLKKMGMARELKLIKEVVKNGGGKTVEKRGILHPDRGFITLNYKIMPFLDENQHRAGAMIVFEDITERENLEKQLLRANKLSDLGELAAGVAHEINNPLATVSGCAEELLDLLNEWEIKDDLKNDQRAELTDLIETIKDQSYRCKKITHNLLNFARVNVPTLVEVDLNEIISDMVCLASVQMGKEARTIRLKLDPNMPFIPTDLSLIQQVFINIFKNAIDATEDGGAVYIYTAASASFVTVTCRDTGKGISEDELERIFDPFYTTKSPDRGTGLGLSICYRILEQLGGNIEVISKKGVGTTFNINIPVR